MITHRQVFPYLNTNRRDSFDLIDKYNIGFNITNYMLNLDKIVFVKNSDYQKMRKNTVLAFDENFSNVTVKNKINKIMSDTISDF